MSVLKIFQLLMCKDTFEEISERPIICFSRTLFCFHVSRGIFENFAANTRAIKRYNGILLHMIRKKLRESDPVIFINQIIIPSTIRFVYFNMNRSLIKTKYINFGFLDQNQSVSMRTFFGFNCNFFRFTSF